MTAAQAKFSPLAGLSVAAGVFSILGSFSLVLMVIGPPLAVISIGLGVLSIVRIRRSKGGIVGMETAICGVICGVVGVASFLYAYYVITNHGTI